VPEIPCSSRHIPDQYTTSYRTSYYPHRTPDVVLSSGEHFLSPAHPGDEIQLQYVLST